MEMPGSENRTYINVVNCGVKSYLQIGIRYHITTTVLHIISSHGEIILKLQTYSKIHNLLRQNVNAEVQQK